MVWTLYSEDEVGDRRLATLFYLSIKQYVSDTTEWDPAGVDHLGVEEDDVSGADGLAARQFPDVELVHVDDVREGGDQLAAQRADVDVVRDSLHQNTTGLLHCNRNQPMYILVVPIIN